jgi:hypothetical protein
VAFAEGLAELKHPDREATVDKSQEESKLLPWDSASPDVITDEAESGEERDTQELYGRTPLEDEEIPGGDAETKVVLLPVNPHLLYVYWEFSARDLEEVGGVFSRLGPRARPVLRFYETTQANSDSLNSASCFEVAIALTAGKWYVRMEHPANSYCLDLGLCLGQGSFRLLARSNVAEMPKACPSAKMEERYFRVDANHSPAEVVAPPAEGRSASHSAPSEDKTQAPPGRLLRLGEALRTAPAWAEPRGREVNGPEHRGAWGPDPATAGHPGEEAMLASDPSASHSRPRYDESEDDGGIDRELERMRLSRGAPDEATQRRLAEFYRQRSWDRAWWSPGAEDREKSQAAAELRTDLTDLCERSFRLSSGRKSS